MSALRLLFGAAACSLMLPLAAQTTPKVSLLVLSKRDRTLSIVDPASLKVISRVSVGEDPHEVVASADGRRAYVSNYGSGTLHTLAVVDLTAHQALTPVELGPLRGPHGLAFADGKVWFTAEAAKAIGRYDPAASKVDWILGTGQNRTHMLSVAPGADQIITTNVNSGTVSLITREAMPAPPPPPGAAPPPQAPGPPQTSRPPQTDWNETVVRVGSRSEGFDISPDGKQIWVANAGDGTISILDVATKTVVATLQSNTPGANRLKFTPSGDRVLVAMLGQPGGNQSTAEQPTVAVIDAHTHEQVKRLTLGHGAAGLLMDPDGSRVFIACSPDNFVAVVDLHTLAVTGRIDAGTEPDGLAWAVRP